MICLHQLSADLFLISLSLDSSHLLPTNECFLFTSETTHVEPFLYLGSAFLPGDSHYCYNIQYSVCGGTNVIGTLYSPALIFSTTLQDKLHCVHFAYEKIEAYGDQ